MALEAEVVLFCWRMSLEHGRGAALPARHEHRVGLSSCAPEAAYGFFRQWSNCTEEVACIRHDKTARVGAVQRLTQVEKPGEGFVVSTARESEDNRVQSSRQARAVGDMLVAERASSCHLAAMQTGALLGGRISHLYNDSVVDFGPTLLMTTHAARLAAELSG